MPPGRPLVLLVLSSGLPNSSFSAARLLSPSKSCRLTPPAPSRVGNRLRARYANQTRSFSFFLFLALVYDTGSPVPIPYPRSAQLAVLLEFPNLPTVSLPYSSDRGGWLLQSHAENGYVELFGGGLSQGDLMEYTAHFRLTDADNNTFTSTVVRVAVCFGWSRLVVL